jgi:hypothetical protein
MMGKTCIIHGEMRSTYKILFVETTAQNNNLRKTEREKNYGVD